MLLAMEGTHEGVEGEYVDAEHVAEQESEDGDEVLRLEDVVELKYEGKEVDAYEQAGNKETDKDGYGKHGRTQAGALKGCACSNAGHDESPQDIDVPAVELEEVLQVETYEVELHNHTDESLECGMYQEYPQAGKDKQRNEHQQESEPKAKDGDIGHRIL